MQNYMREYETIYVMRPKLDDKAAKDLMVQNKSLIEKLGGKNIKVTAMGRRKLAWETSKESRGIFVHHRFLGKGDLVKEWDRALKINDDVLIRQSVLIKDKVDPSLVKEESDELNIPVMKERKDFSEGKKSHFNQNDSYAERKSHSFKEDSKEF